MKHLLLAASAILFTALPAWSQTGASTPASAAGSELVQQMQAMTPEQRQAFLQDHPDIRERFRAAMLRRYQGMTPSDKAVFVQNHPQLAQRLSKAGEAGAGTNDPGHPRVNQVNLRETDQSQRIAQGVDSSSVTTQEESRLDRGAQRIQNRQARDLVKNDGHLTAGEQLRLNRQEDRESDRIYAAKHN